MGAQRPPIPGLWAYRLRHGADRAPAEAAPPRRRPAVWLHATDAGAGTVLALLARQIAEIRGAPATVLTGTGNGTEADPGPGEAPEAIAAHLDRHQPSLVVLSGAILPPALIDAARRRDLPILLVDARRPLLPGRWRFWPGLLRGLLGAMAAIHAVDDASAEHLRRLAPARVAVEATGPLARHPPAPPSNASELEAMRALLAHRQCWFAWSLPAAEEEAALLAHVQALRRAHRLLLIVAPRDAVRGPALAERARDVGFVCARRAPDEDLTETTQVYIADADDAPGLFLRLSGISFLGGSLSRGAGTPHPVLAAALGSVLVFGPHASADRPFLDRLRLARAARRVATTDELGDAVAALLAPEVGAEAALRAWSIATEGSDTTYALAREICERVGAVAGGRG
jgi:3-deoxy-D-manno-octulosonic-acid transferase